MHLSIHIYFITYRQSECCTHISALLHALAALCPTSFPTLADSTNTSSTSSDPVSNDEDEVVPVTSVLCQWKPPKKRKVSTMKLCDVEFEKHVYRRTKKSMKKLEDFDPRPEKYRGTAKDNLPALLDSVRGKGLCIFTFGCQNLLLE